MKYEDEEDFESEEAETEIYGHASNDKKEDNSISTAEIVILLCITVPADIFELIATFTAWVPIVGWGMYGIELLFGALASIAIFLWSIFRGTGKDAKLAKTVARRIIIVLVGAVGGEVIPFLRTLSIILAIWLHNKEAKGRSIVGKILKENSL